MGSGVSHVTEETVSDGGRGVLDKDIWRYGRREKIAMSAQIRGTRVTFVAEDVRKP